MGGIDKIEGTMPTVPYGKGKLGRIGQEASSVVMRFKMTWSLNHYSM